MIVRRQLGWDIFRRVVERRNNATDSFDQKLNVVVDVAVFPLFAAEGHRRGFNRNAAAAEAQSSVVVPGTGSAPMTTPSATASATRARARAELRHDELPNSRQRRVSPS
jgi:hypothetical protein